MGQVVATGQLVGATPGQVVGVPAHTVGPAGQTVTSGVAGQEVATAGKIVGCTTLSTLTMRSISCLGGGSPGIWTNALCCP
jgi:hypothetical protein